MLLSKSALLLSLVAAVCASPIPDGTKGNSIEVSEQLATRMASGVKIKDTKCPEYKITYTAQQISDAVKRESGKTSPEKYNNNEKIFNTKDQLYKVSLDNVARAVFSRDAKKNYTYRGLIEHDKGLSNGFHKC